MVDATQQAKRKRHVGSRRNAKRDWKGSIVCSTVERQICDSGARIRRDDVGEAGNLGGESETILEEGSGCLLWRLQLETVNVSAVLSAVAVDLVGK